VESTELVRLAQAANFRSQVNEKLIKALLALLALKDERLIDELCVVFAHAQTQGNEVGRASPQVWAGVNQQIDVLLNLISGEDEGQIEREAVNKH
jgi:hypothetical protein